MLNDLRFGARLLIKDRSFALTTLLTLAVCIGANAAIFSVVRSVLLRPLPVPQSDRLVFLSNSYPNAGAPRASTGVPDYYDRLREMTVFDEQALYRRTGLDLRQRGRRRSAQRRASDAVVLSDCRRHASARPGLPRGGRRRRARTRS